MSSIDFLQWTSLLGGSLAGESPATSGSALTTGSDGSIYIAGTSGGDLDGQKNNSTNGGWDAFISKYNPDGTKDWTRLLGSSDYDAALGDAGTQPNGTWTLLTEGAAPTTPTTQSFTLPSTTTAIAFRYQGDYADNWFIDNVSVGGESSNDFSLEGTWQVTSLGVGPTQGATNWWSNDVSSGQRACYYDDTYVFNADGSFANVLGDETWLESWQEGVNADGCGAPVAPHDGTNAATWSYDSEAGTLTIVGSGAFLGLPKAHNGGEDGFPANDTITYIVSSSSETNMTVDIEAGSGVWWRYQMQIQSTAGLNDNVLNNIKMYPNPANDYLNFNTNSNENVDIQIFDILGKSVLDLDNVRNPVNVSELKSGVYFVQITLGTEKGTKKLIIN